MDIARPSCPRHPRLCKILCAAPTCMLPLCDLCQPGHDRLHNHSQTPARYFPLADCLAAATKSLRFILQKYLQIEKNAEASFQQNLAQQSQLAQAQLLKRLGLTIAKVFQYKRQELRERHLRVVQKVHAQYKQVLRFVEQLSNSQFAWQALQNVIKAEQVIYSQAVKIQSQINNFFHTKQLQQNQILKLEQTVSRILLPQKFDNCIPPKIAHPKTLRGTRSAEKLIVSHKLRDKDQPKKHQPRRQSNYKTGSFVQFMRRYNLKGGDLTESAKESIFSQSNFFN